MFKKIFILVLTLVFCFAGTNVLADKTKKNEANRQGKTEVLTVKDTIGDDKEAEDSDTKEDVDENENETDKESKEDVDENDTETDKKPKKDKDEKDAVEKNKANGKGRVIKEELEAKKLERKAARLEAKTYIKDLHRLFKDADNLTKKEILSEIGEIKRELKDYSIGVFVRGLVVDFEKYDNVEPEIEGDRVLLPIRAITETLGAVVTWDGKTGKITITNDDVSIELTIGSQTALVNGEEVTLDVAPKIIKGRTMLPMRFITETLKLNVDWDEDSKTVVVDEDEDDVDEEVAEDSDKEDAEADESDGEDNEVAEDEIEDDAEDTNDESTVDEE